MISSCISPLRWRRPARPFRPVFLLLLGALLSKPLAAAELDGTYDDKGYQVAAGPATQPTPASLHALLGQVLDTHRMAVDYAATSHITLHEDHSRLSIAIYGSDEKRPLWQARWGADEGFSRDVDTDTAVVRLQIKGQRDERFVLLLKASADGSFLEVTAHHVQPTTFGPHSVELGTFIFARRS